MKIEQTAQSGTFESSDIMILIKPVEINSGRIIELDSTVIHRYGNEIKKTINLILDEYQINDINLIAKDKGALEPTIKARTETAIKRAIKSINN